MLDKLKSIVGPEKFLSFIKDFLKNPDVSSKLQEELGKLEREVEVREQKEEQKLAESGMVMPPNRYMTN